MKKKIAYEDITERTYSSPHRQVFIVNKPMSLSDIWALVPHKVYRKTKKKNLSLVKKPRYRIFPKTKFLSLVKKPRYKIIPMTKYQSDCPRIRYLTTAGHVLPIDLTKAMEKAGVLIKKMEAASDDSEFLTHLKAAELQIKVIARFRKRARDLPSAWKYDRATARLFAP